MWRREDRRDLGWLGLWVAVYGLAFAPVLHAVYGHGGARSASESALGQGWITHVRTDTTEPPPLVLAVPPHDERSPHSHGGTGKHGHTHGEGSVEHLQALALRSFALPPPQVFWVDLGLPHFGEERSRAGRLPRATAMPQAP